MIVTRGYHVAEKEKCQSKRIMTCRWPKIAEISNDESVSDNTVYIKIRSSNISATTPCEIKSVENTKSMECERILKSRAKKKYNVIPIKRDRCLFRSLAFFIRGDEEEYPEIKREIFNHARDNWDDNIIQ